MELNRAQLLVHNDEVLKNFRRTYIIPVNVLIEHLGPNDVPHVMVDNLDCIPVRIWLIYQAGLRFPISPLMKEVLARY